MSTAICNANLVISCLIPTRLALLKAASGIVPVILAPGIAVKLAPLIAGNAPLRLDESTVPLKLEAVTIPVKLALAAATVTVLPLPTGPILSTLIIIILKLY